VFDHVCLESGLRLMELGAGRRGSTSVSRATRRQAR
jgi:hypothetical protein